MTLTSRSAILVGILVAGTASLVADVVGPIDPAAVRGALVAVLVLLAARQAGRRLNGGTLEEDLAFGLLAFSAVPIAWSLAQALGAPLFAPAGFLATALLFVSLARPSALLKDARGLAGAVAATARGGGGLGGMLLALGSLGLAWAFASTLAPPTGMDALNYHLGLGAQYLARGTLMPPEPVVYYLYTQAGEMVNLVTLALDRSGRAANLVNGSAAFLAALAVARTAGELAARKAEGEPARALARIAAFAAFATMPMVALLAAHTKPDLLAFALFALGVRRLLPETYSPVRASFLFGGCVAVKLSAAYGVVPAMAWLAWRERRRWTVLAAMAAGVSLLPAYWLLRNIYYFGILVPARGVAVVQHAAEAAGGEAVPALLGRIGRVLVATFLFISDGIEGPFGPVVAALGLAAVLALIPGRRTEARLMRDPARTNPVPGTLFLVSFTLWFLSGGGSHAYASDGLLRFLFPAFAAGIIAGAPPLASWIAGEARGAVRAVLRGSLVLATCGCLVTSVLILQGHQTFLSYLSGQFTPAQYMAGWLFGYDVHLAADRLLPPRAKLLSIGDSKLFHVHRDARFDVYAEQPRALRILHASGHDTAAWEAWLEREGFTHLIYTPKEYARRIYFDVAPPAPCASDRAVLDAWLAARARLLAGNDTDEVYLYELPVGRRDFP